MSNKSDLQHRILYGQLQDQGRILKSGGGDYYPPPFVLVLLCTVSFIKGLLTKAYTRRTNTHPDTVLSENSYCTGCVLTLKSILGLLL